MERRNDSDDRRKIERFTNPPVRSHFRQTQILINIMSLFAFSAGIFQLGRGFYYGMPETVTMGVFKSVLAFVVTVFLIRYGKALTNYLANESMGSLDRAMESQAALWFIIFFLTIIYGITYFVF